MIYRARKIFNGYVSVRDYIVKKCREMNEDLIIYFGNEKMVLSPDELDCAIQLNPKTIQSKFGGSYKLYDFKWSPDKKIQKLPI